MLLAELNVRHTRRHMPTRRVALDDGYLPTERARVRRACSSARWSPSTSAGSTKSSSTRSTGWSHGPPTAHRAAHRAAATGSRPTRTGSTSRATASWAPMPRERAAARGPILELDRHGPGAAGDRRDHGGARCWGRGPQASRSVHRRRDRPPGRAARGPRGPAPVRGPPGLASAAPGAPPPSGGGRRTGRRVGSRRSGGGPWRCSACTPAWPSSATTCSSGSVGSCAWPIPTTVPGSDGAAERIAELAEARELLLGVIASAGTGRAG